MFVKYLLLVISIPFATASQELRCSKFDYDERILRKLLMQERPIQDLEVKVGELKVQNESQISNLEDKLEQSERRLQESCKGILRKLLLQERLIQDLEVQVGELKVQYESQISNLEDKLEQAQRRLQESCKDSIRAATANIMLIPQVEQDGWELVFRGTAGNGDSIVDAWSKGTSVTTDKPVNMKRSLDKHYLNLNFVNNWSSKNIARVKFALYYNEMEVASVLFSAKGTTRESWFLQKNILYSSWSSLTKTETFNVFGGNKYPFRTFYISKNHGGCDKDVGYAVVAEVSKSRTCDWETHPTYPMFLYSKSNGPTVWNKFLYGLADYIAVFVQY